MIFPNPLLLHLFAVSAGVFSRAFAQKCALTEEPTYRYGCAVQARLEKPSILRHYKSTTKTGCARRCHKNAECRALRWIEANSRCYLYDKHIHEMSPDFSKAGAGMLWETECFTTDCNVIDSCDAAASCEEVVTNDILYYFFTTYEQYACAYGKTAMPTYRNGTEIPMDGMFTLDGSIPTCDALKDCAAVAREGSFDLHYHIPSDQWVCITYREVSNDYYTAYPTKHEEDVSRRRYSVRNDSVGAGYGYRYIHTVFYPPPY